VLSRPCDVAVDSAGSVYIVELGKDVIKVPSDGGPQMTIGTGIAYPSAIALDRDDNVYVVDYANNNVVRIPKNGGAQNRLGSGLSGPYGVRIDEIGNVYITDVGNNRIVEILAATGNQITVPVAGLLGPRQLAVDSTGTLYISEFYGGASGGYILSLD